jgi:hypothetical protein
MQKQKLWIPLLASTGIGADAVYSVTRGPKFRNECTSRKAETRKSSKHLIKRRIFLTTQIFILKCSDKIAH